MKYADVIAVQIHLSFIAKVAARLQLIRDRKLSVFKALSFQGPHFKDLDRLQVSVGHSTINVIVNDDVEYIYPLHTVGRVKVTG